MICKLGDLAAIVRSKNAGPFEITIDIIFDDRAIFQKVVGAPEMDKAVIARTLGVEQHMVRNILTYEPALAIKVNLLRSISSGSVGDRDVYGAQQHVALLDLPIDIV